MRWALVAVGLPLILMTVLSRVRGEEWWIRFSDFPRLQIALGLALVLGAYLLVEGWPGIPDGLFLLALIGSLAYQGFRILPYTRLWPRQVLAAEAGDGARSVRLLIANVLMTNRRAADFLDLIRRHDPDLILAVETDARWDRELSVLDPDYPHSLKHPQENFYGMHLFSRLDLVAPELRFLTDPGVPSVRTGLRLASGDLIEFFGVHPRPPEPQQDTEQRDAEILLVGREVRQSGRPAIVAGDLNDVAWSHTTRLFQRISGLLDPRIGRGMYSTFPARYPMLRWPLDHVFHGDAFKLVHLQRLSYFGSDHFSVLAELCFEPKAALEQEAPRPDGEDREEAREKIANVGEAGA
jgi:endonuclease/exonuclease/phosphatase (EEP) superfamily protein YafD